MDKERFKSKREEKKAAKQAETNAAGPFDTDESADGGRAEKASVGDKIVGALYEGTSVIISAILIIFLLFTFVCRFVGVIGESMLPTLHQGDWLVISQYAPMAEKGDIVIISQPNEYEENIVKRVIATGGQTVDIDFNTGDVSVDGKVIDEPYINNPTLNKEELDFPITVPQGYVFVMGDNRQHSTDSRSSAIGLIREEYILGKAVYNISANGNGFVKLG